MRRQPLPIRVEPCEREDCPILCTHVYGKPSTNSYFVWVAGSVTANLRYERDRSYALQGLV